MRAVIVTVFGAAGLTVTGHHLAAMLLRTPGQTTLAPPLVVEAADRRYKQTALVLYLCD